MPAYIAFYTIVPRAIGGRLYSDTMGRVAFVLFLVFSMPIGMHHLFADPQVGAGFKFVHAAMTAVVSVPTLLTVFTIVASVEIAGRLRGGTGVFGWIRTLPWDNPVMLAVAFSFVMLGFGGAGGIINMSYQLNESIHNTQWVTGHFHLIFGGAIVIMYMVVAYDLWPQLTQCAPLPQGLVKAQLWLWFVGMLVLSMPWHLVGLLGMPRRMAYYDYSAPALQPQAWTVTASTIGGLLLVISAVLFVYVLARARGRGVASVPFTFSLTANAHERTPAALNAFGIWVAMMIGLTVVNYGYPIVQLAMLKETSVPAIHIGGP
jgi:cytochrome c oxidase subunit 1